MRRVGSEDLRIEFFLPIALLKQEDLSYDWLDIKKSNICVKLCQQYPVIFRLIERIKDENQDLIGVWKGKWQQIETSNPNFVNLVSTGIVPYPPDPKKCQNIDSQLIQAQTIGVKVDLVSAEDLEKLLNKILLKAIPIALWSRCALNKTKCLDEINRILNCLAGNLNQLPDAIHRERNDAQRGMEHIGHHICLLLEDPRRIPPPKNDYPLSPLD